MPGVFRSLFFVAFWCTGALLPGQSATVTGTVTGAASGDPLIGVTVKLKRVAGGTLTDLDGTYAIEVADPTDAILVFSYTGKRAVQVPVNGRTRIDVEMADDRQLLDQVVVTAYQGSQDVKDLVGSYEEVGTEELATDRPIESVDLLLEGRVAGVQVQTVTGEPGLPVRVNIRGQSSLPRIGGLISASTQPLYVLDGVPLFDVLETNNTASVFGSFNNQPTNPLALLNPDDIESITVLKDASATALYGADAANGVVLITTKSGRAGQTDIQLSANYGLGQTINEIQYLNTEQYLELARETLLNSGQNPALAGPSDIETDWRSLVQRTPRNADVDLRFRGGGERTTYLLSAGYTDIESVHRRNGLRQGNLTLKLGLDLGERLSLDTRLMSSYQQREGLRSFDVFSFLPNLSVRLEDGSFNNNDFFERRPNPAALLEQNENDTRTFYNNSQITLNYQPTPHLRARLLGGLDRSEAQQFQYRSALNGSGALRGGLLTEASRANTQWITNAQISYSPTLGGSDRHHPSLLVGGELQGQNNDTRIASGGGFLFDDIRRLDALPNEETAVRTRNFVRRKASAYGEIAYDYDYRYYLKLNGRRDATSIFGGDRQADLFYALGVSWNVSAENWAADRLPLGIDYAKLRASYGVTGNSRLGVYSAGGLYVFEDGDDFYGDRLPALVTTPENNRLSWERKRQNNLALDLGWRERRYTLTAEYYSNRTIDGLYSFDTPLETGFMTILANAATLRNFGFELSLGYRSRPESALAYSGDFNIARNVNRLVSISRERLPKAGATTSVAFVEGRDVNLLYGIPFAGVEPQTGLARYELPNGEITTSVDAALDPNNFVPVGRATPDFFGGLHQQLGYGPFRITAQLNFSYGATDRVDPLTFTDGRQILINNQSVNQLDRWRGPGDVTDVPRLDIDNRPVLRSSRYYYDLDYVQLGLLSLTADLTAWGILSNALQRLTASAIINNIGYFYGGERLAGRNGIAEYRFTFPQQRSLTLGITATW